MKKLLPLFSFLLVGGFLFGLAYLSNAYEPPVVDQPGGEYAFLVSIPPPLTPRDLVGDLFCPRIEARSGKLVLASLWAKLPTGKTIYAHAQAYNFGGSIGWVMLATGPRVWVLVLKATVDKMGSSDAGAKMLGPLPVKSLESKAPDICNGIASRFLLKLSGTREAGLPPSPYTDAGVWPTEEVLQCSDGTKYHLLTAMNGLRVSAMNWTKLPPVASHLEAPAGPPSLLPCSASWKDPDAQVLRYCPPISVDKVCP